MFGAKIVQQFQVEGMTCDSCVHHVTEALEGVKGVKKAVIDLDRGSAVVTMKVEVPFPTLAAAVDEAGYVLREMVTA